MDERELTAGQHRKRTAAKDLQPRTLPVDRALELLAVFVIITGLIGLAAAIAALFHAPQVLLIGLLATCGYAWWTRGRSIAAVCGPSGRHLLLILLVALFFRVPAYHYVLGGQDQGLYVNMAHTLARTASIVPKDPVLSVLRDPAVIPRYIQENYKPRNYLPGIYRTAGDPPALVFQFYHLFPVWMALFTGMFGVAASVHGLTFLALVSVLFFYRLALALTDSRPAALFAGLLLAVNPLHAFFSKFPVSEVPTLAFSSIGFTFLVIYWRSAESARHWRWLVLSALAFFCLFTTRISGFLYLPFFLLLSAATLLCDTDQARRTAIHRWVLGVLGFYALSVIYGLKWSGMYSRDIYRVSFERFFEVHWKRGMLACAVAAMLAWLAIWIASRSSRMRAPLSRMLMQAQSLIAPALGLALLLGCYRIYQLGFTTRYAGDQLLDEWLHLVGTRWEAVKVASLVVSAEYLSPLLFMAFLFVAFRQWREPLMVVLLSFLLFFVVHFAWLEWFIPYQPYFARYLVSEFVPYALLAVVCAWGYLEPGRMRVALGAVLLLTGLYGGTLSALQIGKQENEGAYESLIPLAAHVDRGDLLLIDQEHVRGNSELLRMPLVYTFGLQVAEISEASLADSSYLSALRSSFDDIYLVSYAATPPTGFIPVDSVRFWAMAYQHDDWPPTELYTRADQRLYLSRLEELSTATRVDFHSGGLGIDWLQDGWNVPEWWGVWAVGNFATLSISGRYLTQHPMITGLRLQLNAFVTPPHPEQSVAIRVDGVEVKNLYFHYPDASSLEANIPLNAVPLQKSSPITIEFVMPQAVSPASVGLSGDRRLIGIGLKSLEVVEATDSP